MSTNQVIRLTLISADDCLGIQWLNGKPAAMQWDVEPSEETIRARFSVFDGYAGARLETVMISGDEWRAIEEHGTLDWVFTWFRRGVPLGQAVYAAVHAEDPEGRSDAYEGRIEELNAALEAALGTVRAIRDAVERIDKRLDDPEGNGTGEGAQPPTADDYNDVVHAVRELVAKAGV